MVNMIKLAGLAVAITSTTAIDITFRRFAKAGCDDLNHIAKDTHLHDPHCKSFDMHEPTFSSFQVSPEDDEDDLNTKTCWATVYDGEDCTGQSNDFVDMSAYMNTCVDSTRVAGRSVKISCQEKTNTAVTEFHQHYVTVTATETATSQSTTIPETTTLMLYPHEPASCSECLEELEEEVDGDAA
ncbi:hypothetical protein LTR37_005319 [Vermiconidia calcicola]|uniref:Uncharacterized protein n=1 Tax=Vermiconidia calcicola TaxID=1690605 RepID=A0ACC3NJM6_9PEZI|nr:hypothetical protein LTR37_005319 [Vermiconidia calcicola]